MNQTIQAVYFLYLKYEIMSKYAEFADLNCDDTGLSKMGDTAISMAVVEAIRNVNNSDINSLYQLRKGLKGFIRDYR